MCHILNHSIYNSDESYYCIEHRVTNWWPSPPPKKKESYYCYLTRWHLRYTGWNPIPRSQLHTHVRPRDGSSHFKKHCITLLILHQSHGVTWSNLAREKTWSEETIFRISSDLTSVVCLWQVTFAWACTWKVIVSRVTRRNQCMRISTSNTSFSSKIKGVSVHYHCIWDDKKKQSHVL